MITRMFLIPMVLCLLWYVYLQVNGYSLKQGQKGFIYILVFSGGLLGVMSLLLWITNAQNM
ncbi:conserved hypothetical protein [Ferrimonas balearica DSM 9799]|uniref:Uncharacterized protein n=1 Tax=Ferrimonas balearica (strain DSM 9799 / CCM 4581 / KCTC 23876 / PAT) TaxID=550540 RepID=E1ST17_FERBD|nr:hypothetical protein [Ferrimonas balearica]ADN75073.1 conserved hypothetical protein [Ferrimonas balearica DSM 9799]